MASMILCTKVSKKLLCRVTDSKLFTDSKL